MRVRRYPLNAAWDPSNYGAAIDEVGELLRSIGWPELGS